MTQQSTPAATWREKGEADPHAGQYDGERAGLTLGHLTDDELANGAFMNYDRRQSLDELLNPKPGQHMPIVWMTAVKDRIRWLSRALVRAEAASQPKACEICDGAKGGVPGNENIIDGKIVCDYCHADGAHKTTASQPKALTDEKIDAAILEWFSHERNQADFRARMRAAIIAATEAK